MLLNTSPRLDDPLSDDVLVDRIRTTPTVDSRAFDMLVGRHRAGVIAHCGYLTRQPDHAEDLAQEVFLKAYIGLPRFQGGSSFRTWLRRITTNHCLDYLRRRGGWLFVNVDEPTVAREPELTVAATADTDLTRSARSRQLSAALAALPESLRLPLALCDLDGLSYHEIAGRLGLSLPTVKMRILRARRKLRHELGAAGETRCKRRAVGTVPMGGANRYAKLSRSSRSHRAGSPGGP